MEEYYFDSQLTNSRVLCIGAITSKEAAGLTSPFCDGLGTYLFIANADDPTQDIEIVARVVSNDAAECLRLALSGRAKPVDL